MFDKAVCPDIMIINMVWRSLTKAVGRRRVEGRKDIGENPIAHRQKQTY